MANSVLQVNMLGTLTLTYGENQIQCTTSRSKKVWSILAYLLHHRSRTVSADELHTLLWGEETGSTNPASALKTTLHRVRAVLDTLEEDLGHQLLLFQNGGYRINPEFPVQIDAETFEQSLKEALSAEVPDVDRAIHALGLYNGSFCSAQAGDAWVTPAAVYYQNLYQEALQKVIPLLEKAGRQEEGALLCRKAIQLDSYAESSYQLLMRCLLALNQRTEVITLYEEMSKLLLSTFGVMPDQESRALYREALRTVNLRTISPEILQEQLQEANPAKGALRCDYDFFRNIYQANARLMMRSGTAIHTALFTVKEREGQTLARRSLDNAMENLGNHLCLSLRRGDVVSQCSGSQYVIMLPQANYEDSCMVCRRLIDSFMRKYSHTPVMIDYFVQALVPIEMQ